MTCKSARSFYVKKISMTLHISISCKHSRTQRKEHSAERSKILTGYRSEKNFELPK